MLRYQETNIPIVISFKKDIILKKIIKFQTMKINSEKIN